MSSPLETIRAFIDAFVAAWPTQDASGLGRFFSVDAEYRNGPLEPVTGQQAIEETLASFMALGGHVGVDLPHIVADGPIVMTERVDHFTVNGRTISLPVMGIFEIDDGAITAWRDYFDLAQFTSQMPAQ